jgi:hypothetical protein
MQTQTFKTTGAEIAAYERAAHASGLSKSAWIRVVLGVAANIGSPLLEGPLSPGIDLEDLKEAFGSEEARDMTQSFKTSDIEVQAYRVAASAAFQRRSAWIRMVLAAASGLSDLPSQMARISTVQNKPVTDGEW